MPHKRRHLYLIDGSGFIFRAFHALPPLTRPDGTPVGAVLGFCNMILRLLDQHEIDYLAVVFDSKRRNFRHDIYPEYKANRVEPPEDLIPQFSLIRNACAAFNLPQLEHEGFEADDLIATLVRQAKEQGADVTIVSSDKDLMQLIDEHVKMLDPIKNTPIDYPEVQAKFGVSPDKVADILALAGDASDNIPGVPGIGVKTAAELINDFGDLETVLTSAESIKQEKRRQTLIAHVEDARMSKRLVILDAHVPLKMKIEELHKKEPDSDTLIQFLKSQSFKNLLSRLEKKGLQSQEREKAAQELSKEAVEALKKVKPHYELIMSTDRLKAWCDEAELRGTVAFDTETTSLNAMQAELVGFSLCLEPGRACYVPLKHKKLKEQPSLLSEDNAPELPEQIDLQKALVLLKKLLENPAIKVVGHNIKYDDLVLFQHDITIASYEDTMVLSYDLFGTNHGHSLDELAALYLDHQTITYDQVTKHGKKQVTFDFVNLEEALNYAAEDADVTLRLYHFLKSQLLIRHAHTIYYTIDLPTVRVLSQMEKTGVLVDPVTLKRVSHDFDKRLRMLEQEIYKLAGRPFNIGSPKQLGQLLFEELKLEGGKKGKTGAYGTSAEILEDLAVQGHPLPEKVLEWRQLAKLKSTYTDTLIEQINPRTGRVHTSYGLTVTSTGRLSSSDPNLQNIPIRTEEGRKIRQAFMARSGYKLLSLDYSQIELRLLADMADIASLKKFFKEGKDIHASTASEVFNVPLAQVDSLMRRKAKAINFGIIYGISAFGLARQLKISKTEAGHYIDIYNQRYPGIAKFMEYKKQEAREQGYVETMFGRRCYIRGIMDTNQAIRGFAERQAINAPLQGTAADIMKRAMIRVPGVIQEKKFDAFLLLQVHDELIFEVRKDQVAEATKEFKKVMETVAHLSVPLAAHVGLGDNWSETE
jgi:DNA polymerase-1